MKKELLSTMLIAAMLLSMTACGTSTDTPETTKGTEVTTAAAEEEKTEAETEAPAETEETTTTTEAPKEVQKITSKPDVYKDNIVFEHDNKIYVYNVNNNKMYEYGDENDLSSCGVYGNLAMTYDNAYNIETKEFYNISFCNPYTITEYNPVYKIEDSFDGNVYYFGILMSNGEWALPLSSEYAICELTPKMTQGTATNTLVYIDYNTVYDWKNDKIINNSSLNNKTILGINNASVLTGNYIDSFVNDNITAYNTLTTDDTSVYPNVIYGQEIKTTPNGKVALIGYEDCFIILEEDYNVLYEITGYDHSNVYDATENYVVFSSESADGGNYIIILDKDGNRVVEPISGEGDSRGNISVIGDYVVLNYVNYYDEDDNFCTSDFIVNCKTGEITEYVDEKAYDIIGCFNEAGVMIVSVDGAYYLVDPADPETLINPFEIAE